MAACGPDDPMPPGYSVLESYEVTPQIQRWAHDLAFDPRTKFGEVYVRDFTTADGHRSHVAVRIEHHTFTVNPDGSRTPGCFKGATAYHAPLSAPDTPVGSENGSSAVTVLGYVSLGLVLFSTAFGIASAVLARRRAISSG